MSTYQANPHRNQQKVLYPSVEGERKLDPEIHQHHRMTYVHQKLKNLIQQQRGNCLHHQTHQMSPNQSKCLQLHCTCAQYCCP